jgi:hypothetical protein
MCEKCLSHIASEPSDADFVEIALHPRTAMGMLYLITNTSEANNFDSQYDNPDQVRTWRRTVLPKLASAVAAQEGAYHNDLWQPRYLAILAQAASSAGKQDEAIKLTMAGEKHGGTPDDLLFIRGVALQRSGKPGEAIEVYKDLIKRYPGSPLSRGALLRLALALQDAHHAGQAVVALKRLLAVQQKASESKEGDVNAGAEATPYWNSSTQVPLSNSDTEDPQVLQIIDTLFNFAPLGELAEALDDSTLDPAWRMEIQKVLAQRYLSRENFTKARDYMTPAEGELGVGNLERLTSEAKGDPDRATALGKAWVQARRRVLVSPLDSTESRERLFGYTQAMTNLNRRTNAKALLGVKDADTELENREELSHAFRWFMEAADKSTKPDVREAALLEALKTIPQIADVSPYTLTRALETDAAGLSRKLYDRLKQEFPDSKRTLDQAAYYSFPPKPENANEVYGWNRGGDAGNFGYDDALSESIGADLRKKLPSKGALGFKDYVPHVLFLEDKTLSTDPSVLAPEVRRLQSSLRKVYTDNSQSVVINYVDDLAQFLETKGLTRQMAHKYVKLRLFALRQTVRGYDDQLGLPGPVENGDSLLLDQIQRAQNDSSMAPVADFLDFLKAAVTVNHLIDVPIEGINKDGEPYTYRARDWPKIEQMMDAFLKRYPKSVKREAASMLRARAIYMSSKPVFYPMWTAWPQADRWEGRLPPLFHQREPFNSKRVLAGLNDYFKPYGSGRYFADLRLCRADVAIRLKDWPRSVELLVAQINDENHPELDRDALKLFAILFAQLTNDEERAPLLREIKKYEQAKSLLTAYLKIEGPDNPLRYLNKYLADQIDLPAVLKSQNPNKQ